MTEHTDRAEKSRSSGHPDGLKGFPDAINSVYPQARIQLFIIHMVRNSMKYVKWKD